MKIDRERKSMNNQKKQLLTANQLFFLLIGFSVGPAFLRFPNAVVETAGQDGWIAAIIGQLYPTFVVLIGIYFMKKHPKENILVLSEKYFGRILGSILNFIFMLQFLLITLTVTSDFVNLVRTYIVDFLSPIKVIIIGISLAAFTAYKGLKVLGKTNELIGYSFLVILFSLAALNDGEIINIKPVFGSGFSNIISTARETTYFYTGWESLLLFYPYVKDTKSSIKASIKALAVGAVIWVWIVFITIVYLGIDLVPKSYWSFIMVYESIHIPIINNFRYVLMFVWILIIFKCIANFYFASAFSIKQFVKIETKKICIYIYPLMIYLSLQLSNNLLKEKILEFASPAFIIFNFIFLSLTALLILIKSKLKPNSKTN
ncbi:GerAB/ArcD/ProY family transporter [Clostridium sp. 'deep sea']|uniref:GerAB/ArcD/ProY family transporter n=1 Tax=Clostridium sp. 'deep sea' TaxID=2779445 RepID=UPI00189646A4|nr:GerAB/ArcD/ProY family transporter [Clostridium sp. 'deep sea']QOR34860.1 GerAB/ArcD/ProY family transporter [Clostridium sp. 'deep sea']